MLFGIVLFITKAAQVVFGDSGVCATSFLAGLTRVDPTALSMAQLADETLTYKVAAQAVLIAAAANTLAKGGLILALGSRELRRHTVPVLGILTLAGVGAALWLA